MDAVRGCGDSPPCPGFKDGGACPTEEVLSASCLLHDGTGIQSSHLFVINNLLKVPMEDEGQEEMFMKHLFTMLLALIAATASAYDLEAEGIYYNILSEDERTVEVTESPYDYAGDITIPAEVTYDGGTYSVTAIGDGAFDWCDDLTSVSMPSVTAIGDRAFYDCDALTSVSMPMATTIGNYAFNWCSALTSVEMPAVTTIGYMAFNDCSALTSVEMPSVTTIGNWAFSSCDNLASVNMPVATTIGNDAFRYCSALTSVSMPSVTTISSYAFSYCSALVSVSMPVATTIGNGAFSDCSALVSVSMPVATKIFSYAFSDCSALASVSMPVATTIGGSAFYGCSALTSVEMPKAATIGDRAFYGCSALTSVSMPVATKIFSYAFSDCSALPSVDISSVTTIAIGAFRNCSALTSIDIPASVTIIINSAFDGCNSLASVYCHWEQPLECEQGFDETVLETATLYVPIGTVDTYRSVYPWSEFVNIEEGNYSGITDTQRSGLSVKVIDGAIVVEGGDMAESAPVVEVYSAGGQCVYRGTGNSIGGLGHGIYVVKVGDTVQKVAL